MEYALSPAPRRPAPTPERAEEDLPRWLRFYHDGEGDLDRLTVSSDASLTSPRLGLEQACACGCEHRVPIEQAFAPATRNPARMLTLGKTVRPGTGGGEGNGDQEA